MRIVAAIAASLCLASPAVSSAKEVAGVKLDDSIQVQGKELKLNGAGIRKKMMFKVYVGALYLEKASKDGAGILAADQTMRMRLVFMRSVDRAKMVETFKEGFTERTGGKMEKVQERFDRLLATQEDAKEGDEFAYTYIPGKGTVVSVKGAEKATIDGKDFADLLFAGWVGAKPVDTGLRDSLLGN